MVDVWDDVQEIRESCVRGASGVEEKLEGVLL
jgi:hypothetical protein